MRMNLHILDCLARAHTPRWLYKIISAPILRYTRWADRTRERQFIGWAHAEINPGHQDEFDAVFDTLMPPGSSYHIISEPADADA